MRWTRSRAESATVVRPGRKAPTPGGTLPAFLNRGVRNAQLNGRMTFLSEDDDSGTTTRSDVPLRTMQLRSSDGGPTIQVNLRGHAASDPLTRPRTEPRLAEHRHQRHRDVSSVCASFTRWGYNMAAPEFLRRKHPSSGWLGNRSARCGRRWSPAAGRLSRSASPGCRTLPRSARPNPGPGTGSACCRWSTHCCSIAVNEVLAPSGFKATGATRTGGRRRSGCRPSR